MHPTHPHDRDAPNCRLHGVPYNPATRDGDMSRGGAIRWAKSGRTGPTRAETRAAAAAAAAKAAAVPKAGAAKAKAKTGAKAKAKPKAKASGPLRVPAAAVASTRRSAAALFESVSFGSAFVDTKSPSKGRSLETDGSTTGSPDGLLIVLRF